jgi:glycerol-3-phosphate acyltransferase PlsY
VREALVLAAYLLGSVSFSILVVRLIARKDIREQGSGNAGATNVLRNYGPAAGIGVAILDVGKGILAVVLMKLATADPKFLAAAAVAVVAGHIFPVFFRFRGGKGVATTVGAFLVLTPAATLVAVGIFLAIVAIFRYVSLGSILASVLLPLVSHYLFGATDEIVLAQTLTAILILVKHLENLKRLAAGTERKLGRK